MSRDDFSQQVRQKLRDMAGGLCSNPDCRVATVALAADGQSSAGIGVAAHIHAAAPGGPRYLASMTAAERSAVENGIWLCQTCSVRVDRDEDTFTPDLLRSWRSWAGDQARQQVGRKHLTDRDVQLQVVSAMSAVPTGFAPNVIANAHGAIAASLQALDRRIKVNTTFKDGVTHVELQALEPIHLSTKIRAKNPGEVQEKLAGFIDHGEPLSIEVAELSITGSKLLERIAQESNQDGARFELIQIPQNAEMLFEFRGIGRRTSPKPVHVTGGVTIGRRAATFQGTAWNGFLKLKQNIPYTREYRPHANISIEFDFGAWEGRPLIDLPFLGRAFELFDALADDFEVAMTLDVNGIEVLDNRAVTIPTSREFLQLARYFYFLRCASIVARNLCRSATYSADRAISPEEFEVVKEIADVLEKPQVTVPRTISMTTIATERASNIELMLKSGSDSIFKIVQEVGEFPLFDKNVKIGPLQTVFQGFSARADRHFEEIKEGDSVVVVWHPGEHYQVTRTLLPPEDPDNT